MGHVHYLFDRLRVSGHNILTMTDRKALENARIANYNHKVQEALNSQLAAERTELARNERLGRPTLGNRCAIKDLIFRGAK